MFIIIKRVKKNTRIITELDLKDGDKQTITAAVEIRSSISKRYIRYRIFDL
jgi:hypothetical protein